MKMTSALKATTAALLVATGGMAYAESHAMTGPNGEALAENQTFTYRVLDEFPSIDPNLIEDVEGSAIARNLFEGLMSEDAQGELVPGVATDFEVSDDGMTYTFNLRDNAMWSNGEPVTASDFVYSWRRAADPATASEYQWYMGLMKIENIEEVIAGEMSPEELGVTAIDDHTLEVRLTEPLPYFAQMVTHATTFPVPQSVIEEHGDAWTQPGNMVGNGAYVLAERVPQEYITLTKNENYWDAENVIIEEVTALIINDENAALTRWEAGEFDQTDVPAGQFPRLAEEYGEEAVSVPNLCTYYYNVNVESGMEAMKDPNVRKALSLAIDRDVIVNNVTASGQVPAFSLTPPYTAGFETPEIDVAGMTQEERNEMAKELMAEAGYGPDGESLTVPIIYNTSDSHRSVAVAIGQMWKQTLGVETTLDNQEWQTYLTTRGEGDYEGVARAGWCADYNEASSFLDIMQSDSGYNDSGWSNSEYDQLMAEAPTANDPNALYQQAEQLIVEEQPILPIYFYATAFMLDDTIKGWPLENPSDTWYAKDLYRVAEE
ncbi:oligopeptide ABC transporter, periplasmic oligopeptide-binding protein [Oceanicola granulosus HTCC2516]|uniref:Oligopeptide ABC transporter, periplasmic oligopeptide-binding protein n=1 Tax=Oceanicola granulosus (strain ATCC BAA-861 / DSM 15982 / KCTC 12143 / HTCC2516) TaxID=314256 RepID=Q2CB12_OCEGH|nr:peptide ABC transporter substrate-binding protein [Oceanicola granulosus]EAR49864.1 oligopeptide ABC transporter, periplasmic oligopeptide-binding protein [Oceanicola granulosus HTCC2516]